MADVRNAEDGRLGYIDGLRAVAVMMVVGYHGVKHASAIAAEHGQTVSLHLERMPLLLFLVLRTLDDGNHGVDLFFVISGFCLAYPTLLRWRKSGEAVFDAARYGAKRIARIMPPFWAALGIVFVLEAIVPGLHGVVMQAGNPVSGADLGRQALFLDRGANYVAGSFWTLGVEFRWYLVFPIALLLYAHSRRAFAAAALAIAGLFLFTRAHSTDLGVLPCFMAGIFAADVAITGRNPLRPLWLWTATAALGAFVMAQWAALPNARTNADEYVITAQTNSGWHLLALMIVLSGIGNAGFRRWLETMPMQAVGVASYSVYLVHEPVMCAVQMLPILQGRPEMAILAGWTAGMAAGAGFWWAIERPLTSGTARRTLISAIEPILKRMLRGLGWAEAPRLAAAAAAPGGTALR